MNTIDRTGVAFAGWFLSASVLPGIFVVAILYLVMPPYRALVLPEGQGRLFLLIARARPWAALGLIVATILTAAVG